MKTSPESKLIKQIEQTRSVWDMQPLVAELRMRLGESRIPFAAEALESRSAKRRFLGAWLLCNRAGDNAGITKQRIKLLTDSSRREKSPRVLARVIRSLGDNPLARLDRYVCQHAANPSVEVRWSVAMSISCSGTPIGLRTLFKMAGDKSSRVRDWAVFRLGQQQCVPVNRRRIVPKVRPLLRDPVKEVRLAAMNALVELGDYSVLKDAGKLIARRKVKWDSVCKILSHGRDLLAKDGVEPEVIDVLGEVVMQYFLPITKA